MYIRMHTRTYVQSMIYTCVKTWENAGEGYRRGRAVAKGMAYTYQCIYIHTHIFQYIYIHTYKCIRMYTYIYIYVHYMRNYKIAGEGHKRGREVARDVCNWLRANSRSTYANTSICIHKHTYIYILTGMSIYIHPYIYTYMAYICIYIHIHVYTYVHI